MIPNAAETTIATLGEQALRRHLKSRVPTVAGVVVGMDDDAAAVELGPFALVASHSLIEGVDFSRDHVPAQLLGRKALSLALANVAAKGGLARYACLGLCLPGALTLDWLDALCDGLLARASEAGVGLVGGDLKCGGAAAAVFVTLLGDAGRLLLREGARPGDAVVVTGTLGAAAEGRRLLADGARLDAEGALASTGMWTDSSAAMVGACLAAALDPKPPLALARALAERGLASAGTCLVRGLSRDLVQLCERSGVAAVVDAAALPVDSNVCVLERARGGDARSLALHGSGDAQLLLAVPADVLGELRDLARVWGVTITAVGEIVEGEAAVRLRDGDQFFALVPPPHTALSAGSGPVEAVAGEGAC